MSSILYLKKLSINLRKHAPKSLLLLVLASSLSACSDNEPESDPSYIPFNQIVSPAMAQGEFKNNPDLKNFAEPEVSTLECPVSKEISDKFVSSTGEEFIKHYMSEISTWIAQCRKVTNYIKGGDQVWIREEAMDGRIIFPGNDDTEVHLLNSLVDEQNKEVPPQKEDFKFATQVSLNQPIKSSNDLFPDATLFLNRASLNLFTYGLMGDDKSNAKSQSSVMWLTDPAGKVISSITAVAHSNITEESQAVVYVTQTQEMADGVFRVSCQLDQEHFACGHYRYDAENEDFDAGRFLAEVSEDDNGIITMKENTLQTIQLLGNFHTKQVYSYLKKAGYDATVNIQPNLALITFPGLSPTTKAFDVDGVFKLTTDYMLIARVMNQVSYQTGQNGQELYLSSPLETDAAKALLNKNYTHRSETDGTVTRFYSKTAIGEEAPATN